jgi:hypothetical protein
LELLRLNDVGIKSVLIEVNPAPGTEPAADQTRTRSEMLHSWKEIGAYLGRSCRTVQRWEQAEGLPVHRVLHEKRSSVYALRSELDAWWAARDQPQPPPSAGDENPVITEKSWRYRLIWVVSLLIAAGASFALISTR